eukprot:5860351-Prymnesium_polylepis.1
MDQAPFDHTLLHDDAPWRAFVSDTLGPDFVELWRGVIDNRPGSEIQPWHSDGGHLSEDRHLPPHCITIF